MKCEERTDLQQEKKGLQATQERPRVEIRMKSAPPYLQYKEFSAWTIPVNRLPYVAVETRIVVIITERFLLYYPRVDLLLTGSLT